VGKTEAPAEQGARWATPRTAMSKAPRGGGHGEIVQYRIENQVQPWPTPSASEDKYRLAGNSQQSRCLNALQRGYLNPRWVETLMGVPVGWCDPLWKGDASSCTNRYDELRLLGNGVVPATAEVAIRTLLTRLLGDEA
jgi:hypothetical protein